MEARISAVVALLACSCTHAQPSSFQGLGLLPPGTGESRALGVSADGHVVFGQASLGGALRPIRWTIGSGLEELEVPPWGSASWDWSPHAASADGSVIVGVVSNAGLSGWGNADYAFSWTATSGIEDLGSLPGHTTAGAYGVSGDGSVIVGFSIASSGPPVSVRWHLGGIQQIAEFGWARSVSRDGSTVIGSIGPGARGYRWTVPGGLELISQFGEVWPMAVSGDGSVIVGQQLTVGFPFRWVGGSFVAGPTALPGSSMSHAAAVSGNGKVVLCNNYYGSLQQHRASIWDSERGTRSLEHALETEYGLNLAGWTLERVGGISADGRVIVGTGQSPCGRTEGFIARLGTLPSCYADCNGDGQLNVADFTCFLQRFAAGNAYANCDGSCQMPAMNVADFTCYLQKFASGCP